MGKTFSGEVRPRPRSVSLTPPGLISSSELCEILVRRQRQADQAVLAHHQPAEVSSFLRRLSIQLYSKQVVACPTLSQLCSLEADIKALIAQAK